MTSTASNTQRAVAYEPKPHKSIDYRAFKQGFQAPPKQNQSLYMETIKQLQIPFPLTLMNSTRKKVNNNINI
jgi:hypothetical protein